MTPVREAIVLPVLLLTAALFGGLQAGAPMRSARRRSSVSC
jgi:hypothetical protein